MAKRYCYACSVDLRISLGPLPSNLTGSQYQVENFLKHTVPSTSASTTGVFADSSYTAYRNYLISSSASGSIEVDDSGRTNAVWYAGKEIGASWVDGKPVLPNDAVKLVLIHDHGKVHGFSSSSVDYSGQLCDHCKKPVLS